MLKFDVIPSGPVNGDRVVATVDRDGDLSIQLRDEDGASIATLAYVDGECGVLRVCKVDDENARRAEAAGVQMEDCCIVVLS